MHREGHIGIGLLLYSPFAYWFVRNDLMVLFGLGMITMATWSFLPDIDIGLPIRHRGPTHSFAAAGCAGILNVFSFGYLVWEGLLDPLKIGAVWWLSATTILFSAFLIGFLGVTGHLLGDLFTPMGIRPFWPQSNRNYSLALVHSSDEDANRQLSFIGAAALTTAIVLPSLQG